MHGTTQSQCLHLILQLDYVNTLINVQNNIISETPLGVKCKTVGLHHSKKERKKDTLGETC